VSDTHQKAMRMESAIVAGDVDGLRAAFGDDPAFPNVRDECGQCLLDHAIYRGPPSLVRTLLALGADPNYEDGGGFPSLFAAVDRTAPDRHEVMAMLLAAGAKVDQRGTNDYTALHHAACRDDAIAVELLLRHGADPDARTRIDSYATPLEEAEQFGHRLGAEALRRHAPRQRSDDQRA
jgi:ankyrin repeat protein